jgi:hypothetical protein
MDTHTTMLLIAIGNLQFGIIMLGISIPLMLRQVPMNRAFGIRIRAAFESEQRWYDINAYGGRLFLIGALFVIATGVIGFFLAPSHFDAYAFGSLADAALAVGIPTLLTLNWSRKK